MNSIKLPSMLRTLSSSSPRRPNKVINERSNTEEASKNGAMGAIIKTETQSGSIKCIAKGYFVSRKHRSVVVFNNSKYEIWNVEEERVHTNDEDILSSYQIQFPYLSVPINHCTTIQSATTSELDSLLVLSSDLTEDNYTCYLWRWNAERQRFDVLSEYIIQEPKDVTSTREGPDEYSFRRVTPVSLVQYSVRKNGELGSFFSIKIFLALWSGHIHCIEFKPMKPSERPSSRQSRSTIIFNTVLMVFQLKITLDPSWMYIDIIALSFIYSENSKKSVYELDWNGYPIILAICKKKTPDDMCLVNLETLNFNYETKVVSQGPYRVENIDPTTKWMFSGKHGITILISEDNAILLNKKGKIYELKMGFVAPTITVCKIDDSLFIVQDDTGNVATLSYYPGPHPLQFSFVEIQSNKATVISQQIINVAFRNLLIFCGEQSDTAFYKWKKERTLTLTEIKHDFLKSNLGPVSSLVTTNIGGNSKLYLCCGSGNNGSIKQVKKGLLLATVIEGTKINGNPSVHSLKERFNDNYDSYLLFSYPEGRTQLMSIKGEEFDPINVYGFDERTTTLKAFVLESGRIIQVTTKEVRMITTFRETPSTVTPRANLTSLWNSDNKIEYFALAMPQQNNLLFVSSGSYLYGLEFSPSSIDLRCKHSFKNNITSIALYSNALSTIVGFLFVGQLNSSSFIILRIDRGKKDDLQCTEIENKELPIQSCVHSIQILTRNNKLYIYLGLQNGSVLVYNFDVARGILRESYRYVSIGTSPVVLSLFYDNFGTQQRSQTEPYVFASCKNTFIFYYLNNQLICADLVVENDAFDNHILTSLTPIKTATFPQRAFAYIIGHTLKFGVLEMEQRVHVSTKNIHLTIISLVHNEKSGNFIAIAQNPLNLFFLKVYDETLEEVLSTQFSQNHIPVSLSTGSFLFPVDKLQRELIFLSSMIVEPKVEDAEIDPLNNPLIAEFSDGIISIIQIENLFEDNLKKGVDIYYCGHHSLSKGVYLNIFSYENEMLLVSWNSKLILYEFTLSDQEITNNIPEFTNSREAQHFITLKEVASINTSSGSAISCVNITNNNKIIFTDVDGSINIATFNKNEKSIQILAKDSRILTPISCSAINDNNYVFSNESSYISIVTGSTEIKTISECFYKGDVITSFFQPCFGHEISKLKSTEIINNNKSHKVMFVTSSGNIGRLELVTSDIYNKLKILQNTILTSINKQNSIKYQSFWINGRNSFNSQILSQNYAIDGDIISTFLTFTMDVKKEIFDRSRLSGTVESFIEEISPINLL